MSENPAPATPIAGLTPEMLAAAFTLFQQQQAAAAKAEKTRREDNRQKRERLFADLKPFVSTFVDALATTPLQTFFKHRKDAVTGRSVPTDEVSGHGYYVSGDVPMTIGDVTHTARVQISVKLNPRGTGSVSDEVIPNFLEGLVG